MIQHLCKDCMERYGINTSDGPIFPSGTILGVLLGSVASLLTGSLVFIPLSLVAGLTIDVVRCEVCGSDREVHQLVIETEDPQRGRIIRPLPVPPYKGTKQYMYDDRLEQFLPIEDTNDSVDLNEIDLTFSDSPVDVEITYEMPDVSVESDAFGFDMDGPGDWGGDFGSGDGGDSGSGSGGDGGGE